MNLINMNTRWISGTVLGEPDQEVRIYRGISYAAPPVGDLRWKPPQPATHGPETRGFYYHIDINIVL